MTATMYGVDTVNLNELKLTKANEHLCLDLIFYLFPVNPGEI